MNQQRIFQMKNDSTNKDTSCSLKACLQCGKGCDIFPIMLGDAFTLTYVRLCNSECLFMTVYEYLYEIGHDRGFQNKLERLQDDEDRKLCKEYIDFTTKEFLAGLSTSLAANPNLLSTPTPEFMLKMFSTKPQFPLAGETMKFSRASKENRLKWANELVVKAREAWEGALKDLEKLENEGKEVADEERGGGL